MRRPTLDQSTAQIGAPAAWAAGRTGTGVTVAVLDTGIDATHPDLAGQVTAQMDFVGDSTVDDLVGHGTHVASTIAGTGAASGGKYKGVAPGAKLLNGKVCAGSFCPESAILAGMLWAAESGARVVNLSLGGADSPGADPLEEAVDALTEQYGTLFVVAAGNDGPAPGTVGSPAGAEAALAVGSVDRDGLVANDSSRGPRATDGALKPDVTAPGVGIVAARAANAGIGQPVDSHYLRLSGTSMATPHVAGAAAILAQTRPSWTAGQLKAALTASAAPNPASDVIAQGAGRVDARSARRSPPTR
jgi:subtilisin family serine protease